MKHIENYKGWDILITPEKLLAKHDWEVLMIIDHKNSVTDEERMEFCKTGIDINKVVHKIKPAYKKYEAVVDVLRSHNMIEQIYNLFIFHLSHLKKLIDYQMDGDKEKENKLFQFVAKDFRKYNIEFKFSAEW